MKKNQHVGDSWGNLYKIMRITQLCLFFLIVSSAMAYSTSSYSQKTRLTLNIREGATVKEILETIESQSEFIFFYQKQHLDLDRKVSLQVTDKNIEDILNLLFAGTDNTYMINDRQIIIGKAVRNNPAENPTARTNNLKSPNEQAAQKEISGTVKDPAGIPLPGVSVVVKGTTIGTATDSNGNFTLSNIPENATLVFSFIGMKQQQIEISGKKVINVTLIEEIFNIGEVVTVGFGIQKKENLTGAISTVKMDKILGNRPVTNPVTALQGVLPGLQITTNSGEPGADGLNINIRGTTSINGGGPLILLDNVPVSPENINPLDVESVTVLKDASASSIYGARAAFGVILITTKKGQMDKPVKLEYSSTISLSSPVELPRKASTLEFINALNQWGVKSFWTGQDIPTWLNFLTQKKTDSSLYPLGYAEANGLRYPLTDTDVIGAYLNNGFTQIHNLSFSGGSKNTTYRVSANYSNEDGIIVTDNDSYKRYSINSYIRTNITENLTATANILFNNQYKKSPIGNYNSVVSYGPYVPASGNYVFDDGTEVPYDSPANMERLRVAPKTLTDNFRLFGKLDYQPFKSLTVTGEYTFEKNGEDYITSNNQPLTVNGPRLSLNTVNPASSFYQKRNSKYDYNAMNLYAKFEKSISNNYFSALVGYNNETWSSESFWIQKTNLISYDLPSISTATGTLSGDDSFGQWAVMGYFGRLNYNYKEKYLVEASGRYDGSSKFPKGNRFGFFPSFSLGWDLAKENFWKENIGLISQLKFRGSWGEIGNQNLASLYPAIPGMAGLNASWVNPSTNLLYVTLGPPNLVSSGFTWERVQSTNLGVDLRMLKNRFSASFDLFTRKTIGMLAPGAELPAVLGASAPTQNAADLKSEGWEMEMIWKDNIHDFSYNIGFTISDNQAKITKFDNPAGLLSQYYVGQKIGEIWGYVTDGYYTNDDFVQGTLDANLTGGTLKPEVLPFKGRNQNPGDIKYKNINGDNEIFSGNNTLSDPGDRKVIGNTTRRYQFGIFGGAEFKNFDFSFLLNGVGKRDVYINNAIRFPYTDEFMIVYKHQLDYWTPENTNAYFPRDYPLGGVNYSNSLLTQTKYLLNGSYLRIKNISLGYSLPKSFLKKYGIDNLRIFVSGENLFTFDKLPRGIDTELEIKSSNGGTYPFLKSYSFGLNLTF